MLFWRLQHKALAEYSWFPPFNGTEHGRNATNAVRAELWPHCCSSAICVHPLPPHFCGSRAAPPPQTTLPTASRSQSFRLRNPRSDSVPFLKQPYLLCGFIYRRLCFMSRRRTRWGNQIVSIAGLSHFARLGHCGFRCMLVYMKIAVCKLFRTVTNNAPAGQFRK